MIFAANDLASPRNSLPGYWLKQVFLRKLLGTRYGLAGTRFV